MQCQRQPPRRAAQLPPPRPPRARPPPNCRASTLVTAAACSAKRSTAGTASGAGLWLQTQPLGGPPPPTSRLQRGQGLGALLPCHACELPCRVGGTTAWGPPSSHCDPPARLRQAPSPPLSRLTSSSHLLAPPLQPTCPPNHQPGRQAAAARPAAHAASRLIRVRYPAGRQVRGAHGGAEWTRDRLAGAPWAGSSAERRVGAPAALRSRPRPPARPCSPERPASVRPSVRQRGLLRAQPARLPCPPPGPPGLPRSLPTVDCIGELSPAGAPCLLLSTGDYGLLRTEDAERLLVGGGRGGRGWEDGGLGAAA